MPIYLNDVINEKKTSMPVSWYVGPKKPNIHPAEGKKSVMPLKILDEQIILVRQAQTSDFAFLKSIVTDPLSPEFGEFNTKIARELSLRVKREMKAIYIPLIHMKPSDPTTMMTAMLEAQRITRESG